MKGTRIVQGNTLTSTEKPVIQIEVNATFTYAGNLQYVLYDVAEVDKYLFVVADEANRVTRFLWFQFESFLPHVLKQYHYPSEPIVTLRGRDFVHDTRFFDMAPWFAEQPGSDGERMANFLTQQGYDISTAMMRTRFIHLLDEQKRDELMIIYGEPLWMHGLTVEMLDDGGAAANQWPQLALDLYQRAITAFNICD